MTEWNCPICGYTATSEADQEAHMSQSMDAAHRALVAEKAKNALHHAEDAVEDTVEAVKDKVSDVADAIKN